MKISLVGDAVLPRKALEAIWEGFDVAIRLWEPVDQCLQRQKR
jgi:hypothetical protein